MKTQIIILSTILLIAGCSSSLLFEADYPLTLKRARSASTELSVRIPKSWFEATDNENNYRDIWLVEENYNAMIEFIPLILNKGAGDHPQNSDLYAALKYSKIFKRAELGGVLIYSGEDEIFEINSTEFAAYRFIGKNEKIVRTVVFKYGDKFYESSAYIWGDTMKPERLFSIQNSVFAGIN